MQRLNQAVFKRASTTLDVHHHIRLAALLKNGPGSGVHNGFWSTALAILNLNQICLLRRRPFSMPTVRRGKC